MTYTYSYSGADCKAYAWFEGSSDYYESLSKKNQNILQPVLTTIRSKVKRKEYAKKYPDMEKPVPPINPNINILEKISSPVFDIFQEARAIGFLVELIEARIEQILAEGDFTKKVFDQKSIDFLNREEEFYLAITNKMIEILYGVIEDSKLLPVLQKPSFLEKYKEENKLFLDGARKATIEDFFKNPDKYSLDLDSGSIILDDPETLSLKASFNIKPLTLKSLKNTTLDFLNEITLAIIDNAINKIKVAGVENYQKILEEISKSFPYADPPQSIQFAEAALVSVVNISEQRKNELLDSKTELSALLRGDLFDLWETDANIFYVNFIDILNNLYEKLYLIKGDQERDNSLLNVFIDIHNNIVKEQYRKYSNDYAFYQLKLSKYNTQIEYDVTDEYEEFAEDIQADSRTLYDNQLFEWLNNPVHLNSLATISLSVHDAKAPVRRLGHVGVSGFTKSIRTIAGTMVFLIIEDHPLRNLIARDPSNVDMNYYYFSLDKEKGRGNFGSETTTSFYSSSKLSSLISKFNLMLRYQTEVYKRPDMLDREALNVFGSKALFFEPKELNGRASMIIKGIEITGESLVTSVNDMVTEVVIQFVAEDVVMFRAENTKTETDIKEAYERSVSKIPDENRKPISVSIDTDKPLSNPISSSVTGQTEYIEGVGVLRDMPRAGFNLPRWDR